MNLLNERRVGLYAPACPICGGSVIGGGEMHEVFLTRGDVQNAPAEVRERIHDAANCVILHPDCHIIAWIADSKKRCATQILLFEGYTRVLRFLEEMNECLKGNQAENEIRNLNYTMLSLIPK